MLDAMEGINDRSYIQKETKELYKLLAELKENTLLFNTVETTLEAINSTSYYEGLIVGVILYRLLGKQV